MAATTPTIEPTEVVAGDTVAWTKTVDDYSAADSWVLKYYLRGPGVINITATASGADHAVSVSAATTASWAPGNYVWESYVSKASERFKVGEGRITVAANIELENGTIEIRSQARRILDAHMTAYENRAGRLENSYSLQAVGRSFNYATHAELIAAIQFWQAEVKREEMAEAIARGEGTGKNILVRFN